MYTAKSNIEKIQGNQRPNNEHSIKEKLTNETWNVTKWEDSQDH